MIHDHPMPVELLRDHRGVYGIGVADEFDYDAIALRCGAAAPDFTHTLAPIILRPDRFEIAAPSGAILQRIFGGSNRRILRCAQEESLRSFIHHEALCRAGLPEARQNGVSKWWSNDKAEQNRNRQIYHGLRILSVHVINRLIGEALEAAADPDAIRGARRFVPGHREQIYRAVAASPRALQLADVFPAALLAIASPLYRRRTSSQAKDALSLVERGARLRDVARALDFPLALRHVPPGAAHLSDICAQHPELLSRLPRTTQGARIWLRVVSYADRAGGLDYARWVAKNAMEIPGRTHNEIGNTVADLLDWVRACKPEPDELPFLETTGRKFIARRFTPEIGLKAAMQASRDWHEVVASNMDAPNGGAALPPSWYPAARQGAFEIIPITTASDLVREGHAMHHCVGTYAHRVRGGGLYVFSVRKDGERVATLSLVRFGGRVSIQQVRGSCNREPPKPVMTAVRQWLRAQPALEEETRRKGPNPELNQPRSDNDEWSDWLAAKQAADADLDLEIPF